MRNDDFRKLVSALEQDARLLHNFMIEGASDPRLMALLSDRGRAYVANASKEGRIADALLHEDARAGRWRDEMLGALPECARIDAGGSSAEVARENPAQPAAWRYGVMTGVSCDGTTTCSCTSGTCGGPTCGGSTCSVTCSGDSCGSTCGDSCGTTSNISRPGDFVVGPWQFSRWR